MNAEYVHFVFIYGKNIEIQQSEELFWLITAEAVEFEDVMYKITCELIANHLPTIFTDKKTIEVTKHKIEPTVLVLEKITDQKKNTDNIVVYDNYTCVTVEIITPSLLISTRYLEIMEIAEKYPEYLTMKSSDLLRKCIDQVEKGQVVQTNDLIELYNIAYSMQQQASEYEELTGSDGEE